MKKILFLILILILAAGLAVMMISGIKIGKLSVPSIKGMAAKNDELDSEISNLEKLISGDYTNAKAKLDSSFKNLQTEKQKYLEMITFSTKDEIKAANQTEKYEIGFLWTIIGLYATSNKVEMQANVVTSNVSGLYNISFIAVGPYISVADFIFAIEKDTELGFKIENFEMVADSGDNVQAKFTIRNVPIDEQSLTLASSMTRTGTSSSSNTSSSSSSSTNSTRKN